MPATEQSKRFDQDAMILFGRHSSSQAKYDFIAWLSRGHGQKGSHVYAVIHDKQLHAGQKESLAEKSIDLRAHRNKPMRQRGGGPEQRSPSPAKSRMVKHRSCMYRVDNLRSARSSCSQRTIQVVA